MPDDSAVELDKLVSVIADTVEQLDLARKNWDEKAAMSAQTSEVASLKQEVKSLGRQ